MIRLFLTVFCVLIGSILLAVNGVQRLAQKVDSTFYSEFYGSVTQGTFDLLDEAIAGKQGDALQASLTSIYKQFKLPVRLNERQDIKLPKNGWLAVDEGGIFFQNANDIAILYRNSTQSNGIWSLAMDAHDVTTEAVAFATGPLNLIKEKLNVNDESDRLMQLKQLQQSYDIPLSIRPLSELALTDQQISDLQNGKAVVTDAGENGEIDMIKLDDSNLVFQAGPIRYPVNTEYLAPLFWGSFIGVLILGCLLWMWPLWRDLQRMRIAAVAIGKGELHTRVQSRQTSLIRPILTSFNDMANRTENMVASQRDLTNAVSHELRTPLARMMFDLEMARETHNKKDRIRYLDSLEFNVGELHNLVDELLTYAKQERVDSPIELVEFSSTEMHEWLSDQVHRAQHSKNCNRDISVAVVIDEFDSCFFSPQLMAYALSNTIQNAMRFANSNINIHFDRQYENWAFAIEDDGPGIPNNSRERMFDPFSRLDESRQRESGGFGLGLSIVRKIARWHQGDARIVDSQWKTGTRVEIRWPVNLIRETSIV